MFAASFAPPDPAGSYTAADRAHWPAADRGELLAGTWLPALPEVSAAHHRCVARLADEIRWLLPGQEGRLGLGPLDVRLPHTHHQGDNDILTVLQPDLFVVPDAARLDPETGFVGIPDWVIEVASPYFAERDTRRKRDLYQAHGVPEYWVALPEQRSVLVYRLEHGRYRLAAGHFGPGPMPVAALGGEAVEWAEVFDEA